MQVARWSVVVLALSGCARRLYDACEADPSKVPDNGPAALELLHVDAERSEMAKGVVLAHAAAEGASWSVIWDGCGTPVWWVGEMLRGSRIMRTRFASDGVWVGERDKSDSTQNGWIRRISERTEVLSKTRVPEFHHDFVEKEDGLWWLSWEYAENIWIEDLDAPIVSDVIRRAPEGTEVETDDQVFSLLHDSGQTPWYTCRHMRPDLHVPGYSEWSHSNSLVSVDDQVWMLVRFWDAIVAVDGAGAPQWWLGGPRNDFELVGDTVLPDHAHFSEGWSDGLLVFDNRNHHDTKVSRVVEYALDFDAMTVEQTWSYTHPEAYRIGFLGDARRLPGGNVLIAWSPIDILTEVNRDGDIVWEARSPLRLGRIEFRETLPWPLTW